MRQQDEVKTGHAQETTPTGARRRFLAGVLTGGLVGSLLANGEERRLTSYQFELLCALAANAGRVMSREALMDRVRGEDLEAFDRSIDVHISRIRAAIEDDPKHPRRVITVRGAGYVFARQQDEAQEG